MSLNKRTTNNNRRKVSNRKTRGQRRAQLYLKRKKNNFVSIPRPGLGLPYSLETVLVYRDLTVTRTAVAASVLNFQIRSSAYDPDPALLTGAIPHFVELANEYNQYRVLSMRVDWDFINNNDAPVTCCIWPTPYSISSNSLTYDAILEYSANVGGRAKTVGRYDGQPHGRLKGTTYGQSWFQQNFNGDHAYSASTSGNPAIAYYWNFGIFTPGASNFNTFVSSNLRVYYKILFFEKNIVRT